MCMQYNLLMMSMNLSYIAILEIKTADYNCIITEISKSEAINLTQNIDLIEKTQPAHNVPRTSSYGPILVETSRTIIGPK